MPCNPGDDVIVDLAEQKRDAERLCVAWFRAAPPLAHVQTHPFARACPAFPMRGVRCRWHARRVAAHAAVRLLCRVVHTHRTCGCPGARRVKQAAQIAADIMADFNYELD